MCEGWVQGRAVRANDGGRNERWGYNNEKQEGAQNPP